MKIPFLCNGIIWGQLLPFTSFCASPQPQPWCPAFKRGAIRHPSAVAEHTMSEEETVSCFTLLEMVFLIMKAVSEKQNLPKRYKSKIKLVIILLFRKKNQPNKNPLHWMSLFQAFILQHTPYIFSFVFLYSCKIGII